MELMSFAKKIKIYREINKITQSDLAEKTKIPVATIKKYELSTRSPRHVPFKKIADALNVSANVFLDVEAETEARKTLMESAEKLERNIQAPHCQEKT